MFKKERKKLQNVTHLLTEITLT